MRVDLTAAYVLHTRNYTDSRILVELFSAEYGRVTAVARCSTKGSKKGGRFTLLRPFQPLLVGWLGTAELKTLTHTESGGRQHAIHGDNLYCGMYLNELLLRVLAVADPHQVLFETYQAALMQLTQDKVIEPVLRNFELDLLTELGYAIPFEVDAQSGQPIRPDADYLFTAADGFVHFPRQASPMTTDRAVFSGESILAVGQREFADPRMRQAAKKICRLALEPLLGSKPLKSRELFAKPGDL